MKMRNALCQQITGDMDGFTNIGLDARVDHASLLPGIDVKDYNLVHVGLELSPSIRQVPARQSESRSKSEHDNEWNAQAGLLHVPQVPKHHLCSPDIYAQSMVSIYSKLLGGSADKDFESVLSTTDLQIKLVDRSCIQTERFLSILS